MNKILIFLFFICISFYSYAENIRDIEKKIDNYEKQIKQNQYGLKSRKKKEKELEHLKKQVIQNRLNLNEFIKRIDKNIDDKKKDIDLINKLIKNYRKQIWFYEFKINQLNDDLAVYKKKLSERLVYFYKNRRWKNLEILFGTEKINDLIKKFKYLKILSENDNQIIKNLRKNKLKINELKGKIEISLQKQEALKKKQQEILVNFSDEKKAKKNMIKNLLKKENIYKAQILAIKKEQEKLKNILLTMSKEKKEFENILKLIKSEFEAKKGFLPWPARSKKLLTGFGEYYDKDMGVTRFSKGIDIQVKEDQPVKAVSKGIVRFADFFEGYGKTIILDHGEEYFTVYANLNSIDVSLGEQVDSLQEIGKAGATGMTEHTKLHFEIRKKAQALNPLKWLSK